MKKYFYFVSYIQKSSFSEVGYSSAEISTEVPIDSLEQITRIELKMMEARHVPKLTILNYQLMRVEDGK